MRMKIINLWMNIWAKNDQISKKSRRQRRRYVHISVGNLRILKVRMLKYTYQCKFFHLLRKWRNKSNFESSNEILAINVGVIIFEKFHLKSIFELSYHIMSYHFLSYFFVVYNSNLLGINLNLKFWEKKFLRSALVTKSNNQNIYFKTILLIMKRTFLLSERDVKEIVLYIISVINKENCFKEHILIIWFGDHGTS